MTAVPELVVAGHALIALGVLLLALAGRRPTGHRIGGRRRRSRGGSWHYARPAESEPDRPFKRGQVRNNLRRGEQP